MMTYLYTALAMAAALLLAGAAFGQDTAPDWSHTLRDANGVSCCGRAEYRAEHQVEIVRRDGRYFVLWRDHELPVNPSMILPSPDFEFHVFLANQYGERPFIRCFLEPRSA